MSSTSGRCAVPEWAKDTDPRLAAYGAVLRSFPHVWLHFRYKKLLSVGGIVWIVLLVISTGWNKEFVVDGKTYHPFSIAGVCPWDPFAGHGGAPCAAGPGGGSGGQGGRVWERIPLSFAAQQWHTERINFCLGSNLMKWGNWRKQLLVLKNRGTNKSSRFNAEGEINPPTTSTTRRQNCICEIQN